MTRDRGTVYNRGVPACAVGASCGEGWRDGRVAEGGGLLNRCRVKSSTGGSNPPLSSRYLILNNLLEYRGVAERALWRVLVSNRCPNKGFSNSGCGFEAATAPALLHSFKTPTFTVAAGDVTTGVVWDYHRLELNDGNKAHPTPPDNPSQRPDYPTVP